MFTKEPEKYKTIKDFIDDKLLKMYGYIKTDIEIKADPYNNVSLAKDLGRLKKAIKDGNFEQVLQKLRTEIIEAVELDRDIDADDYGNIKRLLQVTDIIYTYWGKNE